MGTTEQIKELYEKFVIENEKAEKGVKSSCTKARNALMELSKLCKIRRFELLELRNKAAENTKA